MMTRRDAQLVRQLLAYVAGVGQTASGGSYSQQGNAVFTNAEFQWVLDAGLGPLLKRAIEEGMIPSPPLTLRRQLAAADLLARVRHKGRVDAACEVVDECSSLGIQPTLLKGISVAEQFYPVPHLRPMADVDVLVPAESYVAVEAALVRRGYEKIEYPMRHHGPPLYHPDRHVYIELHIDLFPEYCPLWQGRALSRENACAQTLTTTFCDRAVGRLSCEFQLVYLASSWINDLTNSGIRPSFLRLPIDVIYLLRSQRANLDWGAIAKGIDNPMARVSTLVMVDYLNRNGLASVPRAVVAALAADQWIVGPWQMALIRMTIDHYLVAGRRWNLPFPPPVPGRYGLRFQFEKRILGRMAGAL